MYCVRVRIQYTQDPLCRAGPSAKSSRSITVDGASWSFSCARNVVEH